ncbi:MAG TPA: M28 family peptidase [Thermoanaerobaculia bacterium]|nr:M28 family peptidase [Thermoanaerobaculia bacterium]
MLRILIAVVVIAMAGLAVLAIALRQPTITSLPFKGAQRADPRSLREHVTFLAADRNNLQRAASYIETQFRAAGGDTSVQTFVARGEQYSNLITRFGPRDPTLPLLIIGAHYDAFGDNLPGADDNGSGTAGLLELARLLGAERIASPIMLVAYSTEEPPFFGSEQMGSAIHASSLAAERRRISGMICLEMIGYYADRQTWPNVLFALVYPGKGDFIGVAGGWEDRKLARFTKRAIAGAGGVRVVSFSGARATSDASDHRNYWAHGWPAVVVTDTGFLRNPHYHTRRDTPETLDYQRMARVVDGVYNAALTFRPLLRNE